MLTASEWKAELLSSSAKRQKIKYIYQLFTCNRTICTIMIWFVARRLAFLQSGGKKVYSISYITLFLYSIGTTTPLSGFGKCIGGVTALFGVFCITLPVPIVVNSFSNFYKTRLWRSEVALKRRDRLLHAPNASKDSAHIELNGVQ